MGLKKTFQIGRIVIHPKDPNIVYVGALGRLYGPNEERGLFKTTDGGKTWEKVLYVDDKTGVIDMQHEPGRPGDAAGGGLGAAARRLRQPSRRTGRSTTATTPTTRSRNGAPAAASTGPPTAARTFKKVTKGLPTVPLGRIGLDYYRKDPNDRLRHHRLREDRHGPPPEPGLPRRARARTRPTAARKLTDGHEDRPAAKAGLKVGDVVKAVDKKEVKDVQRAGRPDQGAQGRRRADADRAARQGDAGNQPRPRQPRGAERRAEQAKRPYRILVRRPARELPGPAGADGFEYGGVYKSTDGGESWTRINSLNPRPMYFSQIRVDPSDDKYLYVLGISLYRSNDGGKTFTGDGGNGVHPDQHALWIDPSDGRHMIVGCDGGFYVTYDRMDHWDFLNTMAIGQFYHVAVDTRQPYRVYGGLQDNGSWGGPSRTSATARPDQRGLGGRSAAATASSARSIPTTPTWSTARSRTAASCGATCSTGECGRHQAAKPGQGRAAAIASTGTRRSSCRSHNPHIFYAGGNYVFRSVKQGDDLQVDLAGDHADQARQRHRPGRVAAQPRRALGRHRRRRPVGDARRRRQVDQRRRTRVEPARVRAGWRPSSRRATSRAGPTSCFDGHRSDDDEPYVYVTEDFGQTWKPLHGQPAGRLDARAARGHREREPALPGHRVRGLGVARPRRDRGRRSTTTCRRWRCTSSPSTRRPARWWRRRTAAACGCWT